MHICTKQVVVMAPRHAQFFFVEMARNITAVIQKRAPLQIILVAQTVVRMDTLIHPAITFTLPD